MLQNTLTDSAEPETSQTNGLLLAKQWFLNSYLAQLFDIIRLEGLNPSEFKWEALMPTGKLTLKPILRLRHLPSVFYFSISPVIATTSWSCTFSPREKSLYDAAGTLSLGSLKTAFRMWASYLKREIDTPDVWDMAQQEREMLTSSTLPDAENTPFTAEEKQKVIAGLEEIKQYLLTAHKLDPELVEPGLKYLEDAVHRGVGRIDWKNLVISTFFGMLAQAAIPSETFHDVFRFIGGVLREIYRSTPLLS